MADVSEVGRLAFASYVDAIAEEADRLAHAGERGLEQRVPGCPGWNVGNLIDHVGEVYRYWTVQLAAGAPDAATLVGDAVTRPPLERSDGAAPLERLDGAAPLERLDGAAPLERLDGAVADLVDALVRGGPQAPCWNWTGTDLVAGWVARRMAIESALHRYDGERAHGRAAAIETELAVDGIDERVEVHLPAELPRAPAVTLGGSACLVCNDADAAWVVEVGGGRIRWRRGRGPADVVLVGSASELLLFSWNRLDPSALALTGRREVAAAWCTLPA